MSKRGLSPQDLPAAKRLHTTHVKPLREPVSIIEALYDELILTILSYLSWIDLCAAQLVNRNWARLAVDRELWKRQFLLVFGKQRLRGARGPSARSDGRELKRLPSRAQIHDSSSKDWKWMFRISSNWRKGRCSVEVLPSGPKPEIPCPSGPLDNLKCHLLLTSTLTILAPSRPSYGPIIYVTGPTESCSMVCRPKEPISCRITSLAIDQSSSTGLCRILSFLSTGEFMCYQFQHNPLSGALQFHTPTPRNHLHPVIQAGYHHPLVVTLSRDFTISLYHIEHNTVNLTQTLSSFTSFPPVSLVLSTPSPNIYKVVLAYATPVYPQHWTAGATELIISGTTMKVAFSPSISTHDSSLSFTDSSGSQILTVVSTRTARAVDIPFGWIDERKLRIMREQWSRKVTRVADVQTDGKWVILAPGDQLTGLENRLSSMGSTFSPSYPGPMPESDDPDGIQNTLTAPSLHSPTSLQLYRLILPSRTSVSSLPPRLSFVRTLHGQIGPVTALALSDGRCVSLGLNRSVWVWDLEAGTGAEVAAASIEPRDGLVLGPDAEPIRESVSFDERRLIITRSDNVVIRRFDV